MCIDFSPRLLLFTLTQDYIGKKIKSAKDLVTSALIVLKNEGASADLIDGLADLDIDSLTSVDVKSVQLMMHEELAILRTAVESGGPSALSSGVSSTNDTSSSATKEAMNKLETENRDLRSLLKELKEELLVSGETQSRNTTSSISTADNSESTSRTDELNSLKALSEKQEAQLKEAKDELSATNAGYESLKKEHAALVASQSSLQQGSAGEPSSVFYWIMELF